MLNANRAIQAISSNLHVGLRHLNRAYNNSVQNVAQYAVNRMGQSYEATRSQIMRNGHQMHGRLRDDYNAGRINTSQYSSYQRSGEQSLDSALMNASRSYNRRTDYARRIQNALTW